MIWIIFTIILLIVAAGALFVGLAETPGKKAGPFAVTGGCLLVWLVLTFFLSIHTVGQRQVGLVQSFSGKIGDNYKSSGLVFTAPWNHVKKENIGIQKEVFDFSGDNSAVSRDQQSVDATLAVNFQVEPANVVQLWKTVGPAWQTVLLDGRIPQAFKETTAKFRSAQITLKRSQLRQITLRRLRQELSPYDIHVVDVFVSNIHYSDTYEKAIEAKLRQQQAALTAEAKVQQSKAEASQRIATARGEATAIALEGKALRNNPEVLRLRAISKLNPKAQVIFCSSGDCPSILGSLGAGK